MPQNKLFRFLKIIPLALKSPKRFFMSVYSSLEFAKRKDYVQKKYGLRDGLPVVDFLDLFPKFKIKVSPYTYLSHTSTTLDLALLKSLANKKTSYLEIGAWRGESLVNVASVAKECVSVSLSDEDLMKVGQSKEYISLQRLFSKKLKNVKHISADSTKFDFSSLRKKFDLIFVDGDHNYESVKSDSQNVFKFLKDKNSVIVWHDYGTTPENIDWSILAAILDGCPEDKRKNLYRVSNTLCAIYYPKKIKSQNLKFPHKPNKIFEIGISCKKIKT